MGEEAVGAPLPYIMRRKDVIDDKLTRDTLRASGLRTKRELLSRQKDIRRLRGKLKWQRDLSAMRSDS